MIYLYKTKRNRSNRGFTYTKSLHIDAYDIFSCNCWMRERDFHLESLNYESMKFKF